MGMFDHVNYEAPCYACGQPLTEWQSKDGPCTSDTLEPWRVKRVYTKCPECDAWNEYEVDADVETIVKSIKFTRVQDFKEQEDASD